jgi:hypothetical protein
MVNVVDDPWLIRALVGLMLPPAPTDGVIVYVWIFAEQLAAVPPFSPVQFHVHGPLPLTSVWFPALQRLEVGAKVSVRPLDVPQTPSTRFSVNITSTVQGPVIGPVVKRDSAKLPPQVPPAEAVDPAFGVTVKVVVDP